MFKIFLFLAQVAAFTFYGVTNTAAIFLEKSLGDPTTTPLCRVWSSPCNTDQLRSEGPTAFQMQPSLYATQHFSSSTISSF